MPWDLDASPQEGNLGGILLLDRRRIGPIAGRRNSLYNPPAQSRPAQSWNAGNAIAPDGPRVCTSRETASLAASSTPRRRIDLHPARGRGRVPPTGDALFGWQGF